MEAINSPAGKIAQAIMNDPRINDLKNNNGFPDDWQTYADMLLELRDDSRCYALVIFAYNMNWFYAIDPIWTEAKMLSKLENGVDSDRMAIWSGFFWGAKVPNQNLYMKLKPNLLVFAKEHILPRRGYGEVLTGIILAGWGTTDEKTGKRHISDEEMHDVLVHSDEEFCSRIFWQIERWIKTNENGVDVKWSGLLLELLRDVWPRQISVKTPKISAQLSNLAFSNTDSFPERVKIILPLLSTTDDQHLRLPILSDSKDSIVDLYPQQTLTLLHTILPDDVANWPYGIEDILQRIGEADKNLRSDERFIELNRKWNSR